MSRVSLRFLHHAGILHRVMHDNRETAQRIMTALTAAGLVLDPATWEAVPADGGLSHRVFLIGRAGELPDLTARLPAPGQSWRLRLQHTLLEELNATCACVPGPSVLLEDSDLPDGMVLVQGFAAGKPVALETLTSAARSALATCLACLHAQRREHYTIWPELQPATGPRARLYRERVEATTHHTTFREGFGPELQARVASLYDTLTSITLPEEAGWRESGFAQLHGDLTRGNMVWDGESVTLIDWEFARDGDPAEDLAYIFSEQPVSQDLVARFHADYIAAGGDPDAVTRSAWYAPLVTLDSALWWGDYHLRQGNDPSPTAEVLAFIEQAERRLRDVADGHG